MTNNEQFRFRKADRITLARLHRQLITYTVINFKTLNHRMTILLLQFVLKSGVFPYESAFINNDFCSVCNIYERPILCFMEYLKKDFNDCGWALVHNLSLPIFVFSAATRILNFSLNFILYSICTLVSFPPQNIYYIYIFVLYSDQWIKII